MPTIYSGEPNQRAKKLLHRQVISDVLKRKRALFRVSGEAVESLDDILPVPTSSIQSQKDVVVVVFLRSLG
jgi:hypothetical protein